jgi:hypothetical protein
MDLSHCSSIFVWPIPMMATSRISTFLVYDVI